MDTNYIINTANSSFSISQYDLTVQQQRIILKLASLEPADDKESEMYILQTKEILNMLGLEGQDGFNELQEIIGGLIGNVLELELKDGTLKQYAWLTSAKYNTDGTIVLRLPSDLSPFMQKLSEQLKVIGAENTGNLPMNEKSNPPAMLGRIV